MRLHRSVSILAASVSAAAIIAPAASAAGPSTQTIAMNWIRSGTGPTPPFIGTGTGTYSAAGPVADFGTLTLVGQDVAVSSPVRGAARTDRILASSNGTLHLRCFEQTTDFSNLAAIPFTGSCSIVSATGAYTGLHGHGDFTEAVLNLFTNAAAEVLVLNVS